MGKRFGTLVVRPVLHTLIHFIEYFDDSDRQHQLTDHGHKKRGSVQQQKPTIERCLEGFFSLLRVDVRTRHHENSRVFLSFAEEGTEKEVAQAGIGGHGGERTQRLGVVKSVNKAALFIAGKVLIDEKLFIASALQMKAQVSLERINGLVLVQRSSRFIRHINHALGRGCRVDGLFGKHQYPTDAGVMNHQALPDHRTAIKHSFVGFFCREILFNDTQQHGVNGRADVLLQMGHMRGDLYIQQLQLPDVGRRRGNVGR
ncbi:hypothetical protein D3C85_1112440 [compost metagenome]